LGLDNEHVLSYQEAERAWEGILQADAGRRAFFATPFPEEPVSDRFSFDLVCRPAYRGTRLVEQHGRLPRGIEPWQNTISLYRMRVRSGPAASLSSGEFPYARCMGCGNMGWRGFERRVVADGQTVGISMGPGRPASSRLPDAFKGRTADILIFVLDRSGDLTAPLVRIRAAAKLGTGDGVRLPGGWWVYGAAGVRLAARREISVETDRSALLAGVHVAAHGDSNAVACLPAGETTEAPSDPFLAGVAQAGSRFPVPRPPGVRGWLLLHVRSDAGTSLELRTDDGKRVGPRRTPALPGTWEWVGWPLQQLAPADPFNWLSLVGVPASDSREEWPADAGPDVLLRCVAVIPAP
jgi:hypothetical protein